MQKPHPRSPSPSLQVYDTARMRRQPVIFSTAAVAKSGCDAGAIASWPAYADAAQITPRAPNACLFAALRAESDCVLNPHVGLLPADVISLVEAFAARDDAVLMAGAGRLGEVAWQHPSLTRPLVSGERTAWIKSNPANPLPNCAVAARQSSAEFVVTGLRLGPALPARFVRARDGVWRDGPVVSSRWSHVR